MNKILSKGARAFKAQSACSFTALLNDKTNRERRSMLCTVARKWVGNNCCVFLSSCPPSHKLRTLCLCLLVVSNTQGRSLLVLLMGIVSSEAEEIMEREALADRYLYLNAGYLMFEELLSISRFVFSSVKWGK